MPNSEISQIQLPNGDLYDIRDGNVSDFKTNIDEETLSDGQVVKYNEDTGEWENEEDKTVHVGSSSGAVATFTTDAVLPLKSFECEIVAQQASGTPTPDNSLPITGFSQADIGDISDATNITYFKGVLDGKYGFVDLSSLSWSYQSAGERFVSSDIASTVKAPPSNDDAANVICSILQTTYANNTSVGGLDNSIGITSTSKNIVVKATSAGTTQAEIRNFLSGCGFIYELDTPTTPTITPEQFKSICNAFGIIGDAYIVEFGQTAYGGKLVYSNGQWAIRATHEILTLNGTERISLTGVGINRRFRFDDTFTYNAISLSSHFIESIGNSNPWGYYRLVSGYLLLMDNTSQMADETALKTWLANQYSGDTPVQFACELATPVIIPLTSTIKVKTISGLNNIYSNTSDVSLEYYKNEIPAQVTTYDNTSSGLTSTDVQSAIDELSENGLKITKIASGTVALFSDGADNIPVNSFECSIVAQQESGTPTPVNPLMITGFSQADIVDISDVTNITYFNGVLEGKYDFVDMGDLTWSYSSSQGWFQASKPTGAKSPYTDLLCSRYRNNGSVSSEDLTIFQTGSYFRVNDRNYADTTFFTTSVTGQKIIYELETPVTPTITHEQFASLCNAFGIAGGLCTVSFGQTIYSGKLIYQNGLWAIEADKAMTLISDLTWVYDVSNTRFNTSNLRYIVKNAQSTTSPLEGLSCECYVNDVSSSSRQIDLSIAVNTTGIMVLKDTNYTDRSSLLSAVGNYKIVYPLATPIIIPLTSTVKVKTIAGLNNIYSNTGDVSLEYFVNKADDIDKLINAEKSTESSDYHVYSTDEQVVGRWIDGNDIYEKVVDLGALPNNATKNVAHGISNLGKVIQAELSASNNSSLWLTIPYATTNTSDTKYQIGFWLTDTNIVIKSDWDRSALSGYAILRYTKTPSNTRSLNLSKGSSEEMPIEEKKEELKELEEVKEVQDE